MKEATLVTYGTMREEIRTALLDNIVTVIFIKKNGTIRRMNCTLKQSMIPEPTTPARTDAHPENLKVLNVYDMDIGDWRSFRIDSVINYSVAGAGQM